jgi:hypothetical protein
VTVPECNTVTDRVRGSQLVILFVGVCLGGFAVWLATSLAARDAIEPTPPTVALEHSNLVGKQRLCSPYGMLEIDHSYPTNDTIQKLYEQRIRQRATEVYLWSLPMVQSQIWMERQAATFGTGPTDFVVLTTFNEKGGIITANGTTPYILAFFDLGKTGPLVIEFPSGPYTAGVLDLWERPIPNSELSGSQKTRAVLIGPREKRRKYEPSGMRVIVSPNHKVFFGVRILKSGQQAVTEFLDQLRVYPHDQSTQLGKAIHGRDLPWSATPPTGLDYFRAIHRAIQGEPVFLQDKPYMAFLKTLGIVDGQPFSPDAKFAKLIAEGGNVGELLARTLAMEQPHADPYWPGTRWQRLLQFPLFQMDDSRSFIDERAAWFYEAVTTSPQMMTKTPGVGQVYLSTKRDKDGAILRGGETYRLRVPPNAPADQFWAVTVYAAQTRLFVRTPQQNANLDSRNEQLVKNADGSVEIYFGPDSSKVPSDRVGNWIQTVRGEGWFPYVRLYAPTMAFFDKSWTMGDLERVP